MIKSKENKSIFSKINTSKIGKIIAKILLINALLYICACFVLIYLPVPMKQNIKNYDFSSIKKTTIETKQSSIKIEEHWIQLRDGKKLFSRVYPSKGKDIMILIHGSGSESRYLKKMAIAIADSNIATVITPDLRGHGENEGKKGDMDYIGQFEDDVEDLIKYSKNTLGGGKIILAGHSSGGGFVLRYIANSQNTKIDKAVMLSPYLGHEAITVKPNSGNWVTVAVKRWVGVAMLNRIGITNFDDLPVLFFNLPTKYNDKLQTPSYSYRMAVNFGPENYKEDIEKIIVPCLVLVGGKDESFYPAKFKEVFEPVHNLVKVEVINNVNHLNIVNGEKSLNSVIEWLKK